jgi:hypothetical protein
MNTDITIVLVCIGAICALFLLIIPLLLLARIAATARKLEENSDMIRTYLVGMSRQLGLILEHLEKHENKT